MVSSLSTFLALEINRLRRAREKRVRRDGEIKKPL
jgi:hypothetical protein